MFTRRLTVLAIVFAIAGCTGHTAVVNPMSPASPGLVKPTVDQTGLSGKWLQFAVNNNNGLFRPIAVGSDRNIWFGAVTASGSPEIGRMIGTGSVSYYPTDTGTGFITALVDGPEGDMWFTSEVDPRTWKIGKMTTQGRIVFNEMLPNGSGVLDNLAVGLDGDVWFPLDGVETPSIAKSTPAGAITIYTCSFCNFSPTGVALGADGNIWFTYAYDGANGVAKITSNGSMTNYPAPAGEKVENNPVLGSDGRIWFSVWNDNTSPITYQIGAIDVSGATAFYALPEQGDSAYGLVPGPDGRVWYAQRHHIGRVDASGVFSIPFHEPTSFGEGADDVTIGADDNAWFTETSVDEIGVYVWSKMTVLPSTLTLTVGGGAQTLDVHESNYKHTWTAVSSDPTVATVAPAGHNRFSVSPAAAGSCKVVVSDDRTNSVSVAVTVH